MTSTPTPITPAERHHVRYAAAEVVDAISRAVLVMAASILALLVLGWLVMLESRGETDFPVVWLLVVLALAAGGTAEGRHHVAQGRSARSSVTSRRRPV